MVAILDDLQRLKSKRVTLQFTDGEIVDAILVGVDAQEHDDITFDVLAVRQPIAKSAYDVRNVYTAPISSVRAVSALDD